LKKRGGKKKKNGWVSFDWMPRISVAGEKEKARLVNLTPGKKKRGRPRRKRRAALQVDWEGGELGIFDPEGEKKKGGETKRSSLAGGPRERPPCAEKKRSINPKKKKGRKRK